jgi:hypothetical protein
LLLNDNNIMNEQLLAVKYPCCWYNKTFVLTQDFIFFYVYILVCRKFNFEPFPIFE